MERTSYSIGIKRHVYTLNETDLKDAAESWLRKQSLWAAATIRPYELEFEFVDAITGEVTLRIIQVFKDVAEDKKS